MKRVKEYLEKIKVPYTEENADGMIGLKLKYNEDLLAIFPPDDGGGRLPCSHTCRTCLGRGNKTKQHEESKDEED